MARLQGSGETLLEEQQVVQQAHLGETFNKAGDVIVFQSAPTPPGVGGLQGRSGLLPGGS